MEKQNNKSKLLLTSLFNDFYNDNANRIKVADIINRKCIYSRRTLEWFCSNYSKRKKIVYKLKDGTKFDVYKSYKSKLDTYQKKTFDPFKRDREGYSPFKLKYIDPETSKTMKVETTVGQLNFFKWCIEKEIIFYIEKHINDIKQDMKTFGKQETVLDQSKTTTTTKKTKSKKDQVSTNTVKKFNGVSLKFR
jgi:hypothetical protein